MKRFYFYLVLVLWGLLPVYAQNAGNDFVLLSGYVKNMATRESVPDAEIHVPGTNVGVITNEDGFFSLKVATMPSQLDITAIGFRNHHFPLRGVKDKEKLEISLIPNTTILNNVTVYSPSNIVMTAIEKIPANYSSTPELFSTFYRETVRKKGRYVNLSEAVLEMYKSSYKYQISSDFVKIIKGRKLISQRGKDTLAIKVQGGPYEALVLDLVKNRDYLLNDEEMQLYNFAMDEGVEINDRPQYVINFTPRYITDRPLYRGRMYIDKELMAFTRIEMSLDMSDQEKAIHFMLVHKPLSLRFRPRELTTYVNYHYDGRYSRISYVRNVYNFNCDWKKKLFATNYLVVSEMVVTDHSMIDKVPPRKGSFHSYEALDSKVEDFNDPAFWENYNILEPSESLESAVKKLKKRAE